MTSSPAPTHFGRYWEDSLSGRLWFTLEQWYKAFVSDEALLIRRSIDRECARYDIVANVWDRFLTDIVSYRKMPADPYELIEGILSGPNRSEYLLPGKPVVWSGEVCHYERLDRFIEHGLRLPIAGDEVIERIANLIQAGRCTGEDLEGARLGRTDKPYWVTDDALGGETESDQVCNRLGLRSLNQAGHRLVEIRYSAAYLENRRIEVKAPTVLDSWQDGLQCSWIFTKRPEQGAGPTSGRTVDISDGEGKTGMVEAVHSAIGVLPTEGLRIRLRVLRPTTGAPPELSLVGLLESMLI
jgi:hypothetical protein